MEGDYLLQWEGGTDLVPHAEKVLRLISQEQQPMLEEVASFVIG